MNISDTSDSPQMNYSESPEYLELKLRAEAAEAKLRRIYNTPLWRLTKPLRSMYARISQFWSVRQKSDFEFTRNFEDGLTVVELTRGKIFIEANNSDLSNNSIAIIAHYSEKPTVSKSLSNYISGFISNSFSVVLVSACEASESLNLDKDLKDQITIIRKPNLGYDFGSWAVALDQFPIIFESEELILTNDSLIGPLSDFSNTFKELRKSSYDITGITDNSELQYHLQSYFLYFRKIAIINKNIQEFLKSVVHLSLKNEIILKYELGLTRTAQLSDLFVGAIFPWNLLVKPKQNPSLVGWQKLIEAGFPFIKKEAIRKANYADKKLILQFIQQRFSENEFAISEIKSI